MLVAYANFGTIPKIQSGGVKYRTFNKCCFFFTFFFCNLIEKGTFAR